MKRLIKSKNGFTLVEVIIAVAIFTIFSISMVSIMYSVRNSTLSNYNTKPKYEDHIGVMDQQLKTDVSGVAGDSINVEVQFPNSTSVNVPSKVIRDSELANVSIVKKN